MNEYPIILIQKSGISIAAATKLQIESQSIDSDIFICFGDKHVNVINPLAVSSLPVNAYDEIIIQSTQPLNDFELSAIETAINDG